MYFVAAHADVIWTLLWLYMICDLYFIDVIYILLAP